MSSSNPPRLVLTQIELENFKSYYGRRVIGPFHKRFSSIVGPNGSGKSNVIDALLFVFGRRAKQIRLKKISELVHTSENHPNCAQARVNIHFEEIVDDEQSENDYTVIPNSQIIISRIATKKNQSTYLINNKVSTIGKVKELLLSKDVDLTNNRFLILQGEVESIAMMKPKAMNASSEGLLEYLEDIIGSNKYVEKINRCSEQVETLNNEVQERLNRVKVVERDRDKLSNAKNEAIDYIKSQLQLCKLQGINKQILLNKYQNAHNVLSESLVDFNNAIREKEEQQNEIQQEMKDIEEKYQEIRKEKIKIEKEVKKNQEKFQEFDEKDVSMTERLKYLKKQMSKIKRNRTKLEAQKEEFSATIDKNTEMIPLLNEEREKIENDLEREKGKQEQMMLQLTEKTQGIKEEMEEKQKELMPLKDRQNAIKEELDVIISNIEGINNKVSDAQNRKKDILQRINCINDNIKNNEAQLNENENKSRNEEKNRKNLSNALKSLQREENELKNKLNALKKEYNEKRVQYEHSGGSKKRIVSALMEAQSKDHLHGILGRLGDLGTIDEKYDIAVSTAATSALNYIVVEKTHHAQRAVEFLKRNNLGRATMLILEKQKKFLSKANQRISTPNNVPRLYDLIKFKQPKFNVAFYFALRDTLVATDLNEANNLAFCGGKRWRVVTMNGQLIEPSGAMTGGGNKVYKGLMSSVFLSNQSVTIQDLNNLEQRMKESEMRLGEISKKNRDIQMYQMRTIQTKFEAINTESRKLKMDVDGLRQRRKALQDQIPEIEANTEICDDDEDELRELAKKQSEKEKLFKASQHDCELLEDEIRDLEEQILEAGGSKLRQQKNLVDKLKKKMNEKSKLSTKLSVEIKTKEKKLAAHKDKFEEFESNMNEFKKEYDDIKVKKTKLEESAVKLMGILDEKEELLSQKDGQFQKLSKVVEKSKSALTKLTKQIFEEKEKRKNVESESKVTLQRIKKVKKEWTALSNKYKTNKYDFLRDEEDENDDEENEQKEQPQNKEENEEESEKMDVDDEENESAVDNDEEKAMMDDKDDNDDDTKKNKKDNVDKNESMPTSVYISEQTLSFFMLSEDQLLDVDLSQIDAEIDEIRSSLSSSAVNMGAIDAYRIKDIEYLNRLQDLQTCKKNRDDVRSEYEQCKTARFDSFMSGFSQITKKLKEMYRMLTCGGDAELELVDSIDPFSEGVQFSVRPPKKSWKNISNLSGGEKTLSSMALVFALHHFKPTPLYVMDEIDAALDFKNVSIVANYIHQRTKNAQFVIISLRNNMFELANRLVGIYKTNNASKSITIDPKLFKLPTPATMQKNVRSSTTNNQNNNNDDDDSKNNQNNDDMIDID